MDTAPPDKGHQPVVVTLPQYVTTEVQAQPHMVVHQRAVNIAAVQPIDDIIWSLACFVYGNPLCLGLAALIFSVKARDRKVVGDLEGARHYGSTARVLNIVATVLVSLTVLLTIIILIAITPRY